MKWLNSSFLGRESDTKCPKNFNINSVIKPLYDWVSSWLMRENFVLGLVENTTSACDSALLSMAQDCEIILYTSCAHPTIKKSVFWASEYLNTLGVKKVLTKKIPLSNLPMGDVCSYSDTLTTRILDQVGTKKGILVLEHITYDTGVRLPISVIEKKISEVCPNLTVVIDIAQSVGVWRTESNYASAYIGCFHKYIASDPGTGFIVLDRKYSSLLASHIVTIGDQSIDGDCIATFDFEKWSSTSHNVVDNFQHSDLGQRLTRIKEFNMLLDTALQPYSGDCWDHVDDNLRSHINSYHFSNEKEAQLVKEELALSGFAVQQIGKTIRITVRHDIPVSWATEVGKIMKQLLDKKQATISKFS